MQHPELMYGHWQPGVPHHTLGWQIQKLAERNYVAEDYIAETRNANVTKAVHVQAAIGSPDPVTETEWLQEAAERTGFPHGIVAHADLRDPGVGEVLERHCQSPNMRGIRDFSHGDYLVEPDYHRGFALLETFNLVSSMPAQWQDMEKVRDLAHKFPNITIVVDHTGCRMSGRRSTSRTGSGAWPSRPVVTTSAGRSRAWGWATTTGPWTASGRTS